MDNSIKLDNQLRGFRKIWGAKHGIDHEQAQELKLNMGDPEDIPGGTYKNTKNENYINIDNNQSNTSPGQETQG